MLEYTVQFTALCGRFENRKYNYLFALQDNYPLVCNAKLWRAV